MGTRIIVIREFNSDIFEKACNIGLRLGCELHGGTQLEKTQGGLTAYVQTLKWSEGTAGNMWIDSVDDTIKHIKDEIAQNKMIPG